MSNQTSEQENQRLADFFPTTNELFARAAEIRKQLDAVKPLYEELDQIAVKLSNSLDRVHEVLVGNTYVTLVDNFAEKNTVYRPLGIKRFDLVTETVTERQAKLEKALKKASKGK